MNPVDAMLEVLRTEGVEKIFGNPGASELPVIDALAAAPDLDYVLAVREHVAVAMADGYARATGATAFVSLHAAAGLANGLAGILNAKRSRTPLVVTAGGQDSRHLVEDPVLAGELTSMAAPAAKCAFEVRRAQDLPMLLRRAFALAAQPPQGPVVVSIPADVLIEDVDVPVPDRSPLAPLGAATGLDQAAWLLAGAGKPAIVAGDGVGRDGAFAQLVTLAERLGATVFHQPLHDRVNFPFTHPLHSGTLPTHTADAGEALADHDVVLIVGCHTLPRSAAIPWSTRVVQLADDPAELGRAFPVELGLTGGIRASLTELVAQVGRRHGTKRHRLPPDLGQVFPSHRAPLDAAVAARAIAGGLPADAVVVDEAGTVGAALRPLLRPARPGSYVHTAGGGLGWGVGTAVGTRMAQRDRPVVAVLGDGSALAGLSGLWSAASYHVPVLFCVLGNGEYRALRDTLTDCYGPGPHPGLDLGHRDWTKAALFFGVAAHRVDSAAALRDVVASAGALTEPLLVDVPLRDRP